MHKNNYTFGAAMAAVTAFCWSLLPPFLKIASQSFTPSFIIFWRFFIAALGLYLILAYKQKKLVILPVNLGQGLLAGIALTSNYFCYTLGIKLCGPANAAMFIQSGQLFLILFGIVVFKEKLKKYEICGMIITFIGMGFFFSTRMNLSYATKDLFMGVAAVIFSGLSWAIYCLFVKFDKKNNSTQTFNLFVFAVGAILSFLAIDHQEFSLLGFWDLLLLVLLGVDTLIGYICLLEALKYVPSAHIALITSLSIAGMLGAIKVAEIFKLIPVEGVGKVSYLGAILIMSGVILLVWKNDRRALSE